MLFFKLILLPALIFTWSTTLVYGQAGDQKWQDRLAVSLNGKLPDTLPAGFENTFWHSHRTQLGAEEKFELHARPGGRPLFDDPTAQELCEFIVDGDIKNMTKLLDQGVDVNSIGIANITPLFVAFFNDTDPRPFELLLDRGADPNIYAGETSMPPPFKNFPFFTVANLVARTKYNRLFEKVYVGTGNPERSFGLVPVSPFEYGTIHQPDGLERLKLLVKKSQSLEKRFNRNDDRFGNFLYKLLAYSVAETDAAKREHNYQLALVLVKNGEKQKDFYVEYNPQYPDGEDFRYCKFKAIHMLAQACLTQKIDEDLEANSNFNELASLLDDEGLTLASAKKDLKRWYGWQKSGLAELITIENRKRAKGESIDQWLQNGIDGDITKIQSAPNWNSASKRINYFPVSLRSGYRSRYEANINSKWQDRVWSDVVAGGLIDQKTIQNWQNSKIFEDPQVEALKDAMFSRNMTEVERLIKEEHVNVNAIGKDNLTLVYLAVGIVDDPRPIELLLRHGANPNVINNAQHKQQGMAAVHVIAKTKYCRLFRTIFEYGGDPNLVAAGRTPIGFIPKNTVDWQTRVELLCRKGGDISKAYLDTSIPEIRLTQTYLYMKQNKPRSTPHRSIGRDWQYLTALKLGAPFDFTVEDELSVPKYPADGEDVKTGKCWLQIPHLILEIQPDIGDFTPPVIWLEKRGFSFKEARADLKRWKKWIEEGTPELIQQEYEAGKQKQTPEATSLCEKLEPGAQV